VYNGNIKPIKNTRIRQGNIIHETLSPEMPLGTELDFHLDWDYRYKLMKLHSAQHVLSRYFQKQFQAETVSTQIKKPLVHKLKLPKAD
jgi:Ser-tRNA(Ala) deacylase AlaX